MKIIETISAMLIMALGIILSVGLGKTAFHADIDAASPYEMVQLAFSVIMSLAMAAIGAAGTMQNAGQMLARLNRPNS